MEHLDRAATGFKLSQDWGALARTLSRIAQAHHIQGDLELAIQILEQAKTYNLKTGDRYFDIVLCTNISHCQLLLGLWRPAFFSVPKILEEMKKANDFPSQVISLLDWGYANLLGGRLKQSRKRIREALRICIEQNILGHLKIAHGYFGELSLAEKQYEQAEEHLRKAIEIAHRVTPGGSTETQAWRVLGDVYVAQKQFENAKKAYTACQSCLAKFPEKLEEGAAYRGMGVVYAHDEQQQLARRTFKKALDIFETCTNQWEKAKTFVIAAESGVFTQAEMQPDIAWAKEVFKKLEHPAWINRVRTLLRKSKNIGKSVPLRLARERAEREQIVKALLVCNGNISATAKKLGLLRQTLQYKIRHYGIEV